MLKNDILNANDNFIELFKIIENGSKKLTDVELFIKEIDSIYIDEYFLKKLRQAYRKTISN